MGKDEEVDIAVLSAEHRALVERVEKLEETMSKGVVGVVALAIMLIWEPLQRIVTGGGQ